MYKPLHDFKSLCRNHYRVFTFLLMLAFVFSATGSLAQSNYALSFNGTNNYVSIGTPLSGATSYTKEAWVYQTSTAGSQNIISSANAPFWISGGTLSAGQAGVYSVVTDATTFPLNKWVHVAVTYDASTLTMKLYRDGNLLATALSVAAYTSENTFIGSHQGSTSFFAGMIDEVRLWNTALTQAQIKAKIYSGPKNNATGLLAYYKFNDGSGSTLTSSCTNTSGLNGTLQNSPSWVASPVQFGANALSFDGTNDFVTSPSATSLNITSAITLEAWVYATKNSGIQNVINKSSNAINTGYIFPRTDDGWSHVVMYLHIGGWHTLSAVYPGLNAWHHLAATYDGATMKLYIDGVLSASQAQTGSIATNTNPLTLGNQTGYSEYFGGSADEFRIWNVAKTQAEIQANMNKELDPTLQTGLVSYFTMDQGISTGTNTGLLTAVDLAGTNNGTLTNFSLSGASSNIVAQNATITPLTVSWLSFTAQKQSGHVILNWATASEENSRDFTVQKSLDGKHWNNTGTLAAAGNSNARSDYSYIDYQPSAGLNYYRILQSDLDGKISYSTIQVVDFSATVNTFMLMQNPASHGSLQVLINKPTTLSLFDMHGKLLWQKQLTTGLTGISTIQFAKGIYFLTTGTQSQKILIE